MMWLNLETIKAHSRIDYKGEDDLLTVYANSAERTILQVCNRSFQSLKECKQKEDEEMGDGHSDYVVPDPIVQATLMLVDLSYTQRSPVTSQNLYLVPYTFDLLVKPYMIL